MCTMKLLPVIMIWWLAAMPCRAGGSTIIDFRRSDQTLGNARTFSVAIEDVDQDGDNDIFITNYIGPSGLWLNDGEGVFSPSPQSFNLSEVHGVGIRDLNGDNSPDILLLSHTNPSKVFFNNGSGAFTPGEQNIGVGVDYPGMVALGDVDNDGDVDAFISYYTLPNRLWLNDGNGHFSVTSAAYGVGNGGDMELADVNGDTFLDLFITFSDQPDEVWINDGSGTFIDSGQRLGNSAGYESTASGDVDADGDVDFAVGNSVDGVQVWLNQDNTGSFVAAGPYFEAGTSKVELFDADLDGDLDLITTHLNNGNKLWINDGSAVFAAAGQLLGNARAVAIACDRLDKDADLDVVLGMGENTGGNPIYFNESVNSCFGTVSDVDGNVYRTVTIGAQEWMAENLKVTHYRNGDPIANVSDSSFWLNQTGGAYCNYANDVSNVEAYGRLYNWYAPSDNRNIAPAGWHVPSDIEWQSLVDFLGGDAIAGWKLKESGTAHWLPPNTGATNECGFTALPGGYRGWYGIFADLGNYATFWTATGSSSTHAWYRSLSYDNPDVSRFDSKKHYGFAVRCIKDVGCCVGRVGDANGDGSDEPTIGDVSVLIDARFITGSCSGIIDCMAEADINQSGGGAPACDDLTIGDISVLIDYLFITGISLGLPDCLSSELSVSPGTAVTIDGVLQPGEWDDAHSVRLAVEDRVDVAVSVKHDGANLLLAYVYDFAGEGELCMPEIFVDTEQDRSPALQPDDWWFHVSGTDCEAHGSYGVYTDCSIVQPDWLAAPNFPMVPNPPPLDTFEIAIPFTKLGVSAGSAIGLAFRVELMPSLFAYWPASAMPDDPSTWARAVIRP